MNFYIVYIFFFGGGETYLKGGDIMSLSFGTPHRHKDGYLNGTGDETNASHIHTSREH